MSDYWEEESFRVAQESWDRVTFSGPDESERTHGECETCGDTIPWDDRKCDHCRGLRPTVGRAASLFDPHIDYPERYREGPI